MTEANRPRVRREDGSTAGRTAIADTRRLLQDPGHDETATSHEGHIGANAHNFKRFKRDQEN